MYGNESHHKPLVVFVVYGVNAIIKYFAKGILLSSLGPNNCDKEAIEEILVRVFGEIKIKRDSIARLWCPGRIRRSIVVNSGFDSHDFVPYSFCRSLFFSFPENRRVSNAILKHRNASMMNRLLRIVP